VTSHDETVTDDRLRLIAPDVLGYFRARVSSPEDSADLLAETLLITWKRRDAAPSSAEGLRMWTFGIARNVLRNWMRGQRRRYELAQQLRNQLVTETLAPDLHPVRDAISRLPSDQAELVRLIHWEGFSLIEAASILKIRESTARGRYQRARRSLAADPAVTSLRGQSRENW
jgi:RNA polymerase sigma-70 factor (ECF subfamily)